MTCWHYEILLGLIIAYENTCILGFFPLTFYFYLFIYLFVYIVVSIINFTYLFEYFILVLLIRYCLFPGVSVLEVVLSHMVVQFIVLSMQTTLMMLVLFVLYDNPLKGSLVWILLMLFLTGASGMCYGKEPEVSSTY